MKEIKLQYDVRRKPISQKADITVFEPNELPIYPGLQVVVITEPRDYEGLSVTNGSEYIATALMRKHGIGPFGTAYIEHYRDKWGERVREGDHPSFDAVWYKWKVVEPGCPVKIAATSPLWHSLPYSPYYPVLLDALGEETPEYILAKIKQERVVE